MPYYFGEGDPGWPEGDDDEYHHPKASQFRYLPPPELGGAPEPVHFSDRVPPPSASARAQSETAAPSLLSRLLGRGPPPPQPPRRAWQEQQREQERRGQHALALFVAALRGAGVRRVYCRYDGGNDEGFAWLDHAELRSGERLVPAALAKRLGATPLLDRLADADLWHRRRLTAARDLQDMVDITFATECAARLLGGGYGTGPFCLYGAFTVDLDACTIVDDRSADPVVRNFTIET